MLSARDEVPDRAAFEIAGLAGLILAGRPLAILPITSSRELFPEPSGYRALDRR